ncbi:GyrI-like domain-containing protein [Ornithinimicrobium pekingense]|uniref:Transcriptional regulator n=1 Tax=Ornithinimicrobium pekingense TaxID=384677 RepID=A0ABQ2FAC7_9MICO|nr:GyrI-like domain-containing protein [Ornithinimicrobium pekingense]GGK68176.1 transcriptional regulator [Ornithinimicrobium pekingense]
MDIPPEASSPEIVRREEVPTAVVRATVRMDEISQVFDRAYPLVASTLEQQGGRPLEAIGYYPSMPSETIDVEAGFTTAAPATDEGDVVVSSLPGGDVARLTHLGPYDTLAESWERLGRWVAEQGRRPGRGVWEVYVSEPTPDSDPATLRTDIYWPLES